MAKGGDLILWDSRTIHGGLVGDWEEGKGKGEGGRPEGVEEGRMARLTVTACMLPRKKASKLALRKRKEGFEAGRGFNHEAPPLSPTSTPSPKITLNKEKDNCYWQRVVI